MDNNNVPFVLSYNIENGQTFNPHHIDYRKVIKDYGYESIWRFDSAVRPPYVFELFYKGDIDVSYGCMDIGGCIDRTTDWFHNFKCIIK